MANNNNVQPNIINKLNSKNKLKVFAINVNSIVKNQRRASLLRLIEDHLPDILLLGETKLRNNHVLRFTNYHVIRDDRDALNAGGGTAILIRKGIKYEKVSIPVYENKFKVIEHTGIKCSLSSGDSLFIFSLYAKCGGQKEFIPELSELFRYFNLGEWKNYFIMAGDLNAKHTNWSNANNNARGVSLNKWLETNNMIYKINFLSTRYPSYPNGQSYLDVLMIDARMSLHNLEAGNKLKNVPYDSDHNAVEFQVSLDDDLGNLMKAEKETMKLDYKKTDWSKFESTLQCIYTTEVPNNVNLTLSEINKFLSECDEKILEAIDICVPKIKEKDSVKSYINDKIKKLQKKKNKVLTCIHKVNKKWPRINLLRLEYLKKELREIREELKIEFASSISNYWKEKIMAIAKRDACKMFPRINNIFRKKAMAEIGELKVPKDSNLLEPAGIDAGNSDDTNDIEEIIVTKTYDKINLMGAHFASINNRILDNDRPQFNTIVDKENNKFKDRINKEEQNNSTLCDFSNNNLANIPNPVQEYKKYFTTVEELHKRFGRLNNKKSSGLDGIPNIVLKHIPSSMIRNYTILFNNLLNRSYFPEKWKTAKVVPILKKNKNRNFPASYRPISLLPNISKVFEMIVNDILVEYCDANQIIPECQFGFRRKLSTVHALNKLTSDIQWAYNGNKCLGAVLIDLEKAFDTVWLDGLLYKMLKNKFPHHLTKLIWSMIKGRSLVVACGNSIASITFATNNGLQQGTVNSPILFSIYTADLLKIFEFNKYGESQVIAFADDLIVYLADDKVSIIQNKLQTTFNKLEYYFQTWKLSVNVDKCETILFRKPLYLTNRDVKRNYKTFSISSYANLERRVIPHKNMVKYLGVCIDERLHYKTHVYMQLGKATQTFMSLRRLFYSRNLHTEVKVLCYQLLIRPIIAYACCIWFNVSASIMERIRVFERKCLRACLNLNRTAESDYTKYVSNLTLYNTAKIPRIDNFMITLMRDHFAQACRIHSNSLVYCAIFPNDMYYSKTLDTGYIPPEAFIYLDKLDFIQDANGIPIIYHYPRHNKVKRITYPIRSDSSDTSLPWKYDMSVPEASCLKSKRYKVRYWWNNPETQ